MGRGLSDLQQTILRLALARWEASRPDHPAKPVVTREEVLTAHFGWQPLRTRRW